MKENKRIFVGPHEVAGYYKNLSRGFKDLGVDHDFVTYTPNPFAYGGETKSPRILKLANMIDSLRHKHRTFRYVRFLLSFLREMLRSCWAISTIFRYDIFIFGAGKSLLRCNLDLFLLRWLNKKVICNLAHGSESRPPVINGFLQSKSGNVDLRVTNIKFLTRKVSRRVRRVENNSDLLIGAPLGSTQFAKKTMINSFMIGIPYFAVDQYNLMFSSKKNLSSYSTDSIVKILHSPSHPEAKGTRLIESAIKSLQRKGHIISFVLIQKRPHNEVLDAIQSCDFVVDQVYSDTPMAGFATEAAWFGKPAVVGGYGFDKLRTVLGAAMWPPSKICDPDNIEKAIEDLIVDVEERQRIGSSAQEFVRRKWRDTEVARRYLRLIDEDIPEEWWLDPATMIYVEGAGQSADSTRACIRQMVNKYGVSSLQLSHRPELEQAFLEFAGVQRSR